MNRHNKVVNEHRIFRYVLIYATNGKVMSFICRKHLSYRIFIPKYSTGKALRYKNASGHNHIFGGSFQYRYAKGLKETSVSVDVIYIR